MDQNEHATGCPLITGWVKLYHPRGPLVTLSVPADPAQAFSHIDQCLDAGWLQFAPGLEEGEVQEQVGYVVRGSVENNGKAAPFLLLYDAEPSHKFSFLKVYLDTPEEIEAFEAASRMKLSEIPEYVGNDKPERGKSAKIDQFIVRCKSPFSAVLVANSKYDEAERTAVIAKGEVYKVPRRLFVRWVSHSPPQHERVPNTAQPAPVKPGQEPASAPRSEPRSSSKSVGTGKVVPDALGNADQRNAKVVEQFRAVMTMEHLDQWAVWAGKQNFAPHHREEQSDEYYQAQERIAATMKPQKAAAPVGVDGVDIPF